MDTYEKELSDLQDHLACAMKTQDFFSKNVIRQMMTALRNGAISMRRNLNEAEIREVYTREVKQYREALEAAEASERPELIHKAKSELARAVTFLPPQLTEDDVREIIAALTHEVLATTMKDMPNMMKALMPRIKGQFDGRRAKELVEEVLDIQQVV